MFFQYLFGVIIIAIFYSINKGFYERELNEGYFESQEFIDTYMYSLREEMRSLIHNTNEPHIVNNKGARIYYRLEGYNAFSYLKDCKYLIIHNEGNKVYTNMTEVLDNPDLSQIYEYIKNMEGKKFLIENGNLKADAKVFQEQWENYKNTFEGSYYYTPNQYYNSMEEYEKATMNQLYSKLSEEINELDKESIKLYIGDEEQKAREELEKEIVYVDYNINDFTVYISYKEEFKHSNYDEYILNIMQVLQKFEDLIYISVPICGIFVVIIIVYLVIAIGYKKNKKGVDLNDVDRIPIEIIICILLVISTLIGTITIRFTDTRYSYYKLYLSGIITAYAVIYILSAITFTTVVKRIKAKVLIKKSLTWRMLQLIKRIFARVQKIIEVFTERIGLTWKIILISAVYLTTIISIMAVFIDVSEQETGIFANIIITGVLIYYIVKRANCFKNIENQLKKIYEGDNKERLQEEEFTKEFKAISRYINDISNGFENAVEEGIKSERLKTELITNVSHDIKTPLTSIINYADLIKQENIENEKVNEYVDILLSKSHRLKRLTEDLVEASKASSGNVKLNLETLNLGELINQTTGEFEDKFKEKNLEIVIEIPKSEIYVEADSRYMYRIIENIFSNVSKYALYGSRVYVDMIRIEEKVKIEIKNISEEKLNISEEELMQRFVRGDKSRTTEGSGLRTFNIKKPCRTSKGKL